MDSTHAHMNIPATLMWARGFEMRPARVTFVPPPGQQWRVATQLYPTVDPYTFHCAKHALPDGQPDRVQRLHAADVQRSGRRCGRRTNLPHCAPSRRHRRRRRCVGSRHGSDRARSESRVRRVPALREQHLHVSLRLSALGERRRHGASQQHRSFRQRCVARSGPPQRHPRHGGARVLSFVEHGADPIQGDRAVQLRRGERLE